MTDHFNATAAPFMRRPGVVLGVTVSLLLHALLIFGYRFSAPPPAPDRPANKTMTVWLRPAELPRPPPPILAKVEPKIEPRTETPPRKRIPQRQAGASAPAPARTESAADTTASVRAVPPPASSAPDPLYPDAAPKQFDMNAALKTARKVASEKDPAREGTVGAQLDAHPLYPEDRETQLQKGVASAKRGDCRNTPGGLLAPLIWLMDKKDHGCKW